MKFFIKLQTIYQFYEILQDRNELSIKVLLVINISKTDANQFKNLSAVILKPHNIIKLSHYTR